MSDEHKNGHLGGPLGIAGAGAMLAAGALFVYAGFGATTDTVDPVIGPDTGDTLIDRPVDTSTGTIDKPDTTPIKPDVVEPVKPDPDTGSDTGKPDPQPVVKPVKPDIKVDPQTEPVKPVIPPAVVKGPGDRIVLIVKVKNDAHFTEAVKLHRKDKAGAARAYAAFIEANPAFKDMEFISASFSGEAKLAYTFPEGGEATRPAVKRVQDKLMAVDGVSYADLDQIVTPAKGN